MNDLPLGLFLGKIIVLRTVQTCDKQARASELLGESVFILFYFILFYFIMYLSISFIVLLLLFKHLLYYFVFLKQ